jgi:hypothetical protein
VQFRFDAIWRVRVPGIFHEMVYIENDQLI